MRNEEKSCLKRRWDVVLQQKTSRWFPKRASQPNGGKFHKLILVSSPKLTREIMLGISRRNLVDASVVVANGLRGRGRIMAMTLESLNKFVSNPAMN